MATIQTFKDPIIIDIPNHPVLGFPMKAKFRALITNDDTETLVLQFSVWAVNAEGFPLDSNMLNKIQVDLKADNNTIVDAATGGSYVLNPDDPQWDNVTTLYGEYDFFTMARTQPIIIKNMIIEKVNIAVAAGRFFK